MAADVSEQFRAAGDRMKEASQLLLECSKIASEPEAKQNYKRLHKQMVRMIREWNRLDGLRGGAKAETPFSTL